VNPTPDGDLAEAFADIARRLHGESSPKKVRERIGGATVHTVGGCDHAAISLVYRHRAIDTVGATDGVPHQVDAIQYEVGQGPCLNAIAEHEVFLIDDLAIDERWPRFSRRAAEETGVRSMLSFRLFLEEDVLGALNLYSRKVQAFDEQGYAVGTVLATHAAIAMRGAQERDRGDQLEQALASNREIGMAMGLLMARGLMTEDQAFAVLRRAFAAPQSQAAGGRCRAHRDGATTPRTSSSGIGLT
jgi:transcriptional regulator with GAF, ATPase, and Fis domain